MRCILFTLLVLCFISCNNKFRDATLVITNINIIDPVHQKIIPGQTILIKDSIIVGVVSAGLSKMNIADALVIDGTGKYIISGFWNMHTHVCWKDNLSQTVLPVLLSYGITGVRDMGGDVAIMNNFKKQILQNPVSGPVIYGAGPILDGDPPVHPDFSIALTKQNFKQKLDSLYTQKPDFFKVYSLLPEELVEEISVYARQKHMNFAGHISEYIPPVRAAQLHQKSFEHLNRIDELYHDSMALNGFIAAVKTNNTWLCPTLIVYQRKVEMAEGKKLQHPLYESIDPSLKQEWLQAQQKRREQGSAPDKLAMLKNTFSEQKALVTRFYKENIPMLIGSDFAGMAFIYPGYSFHEEMALLSQTGFSNYDILKMATYNPAVYFNITNKHGTIEKGKIANMVMLDENPVVDIRNTLKIGEVIRQGKRIVIISQPQEVQMNAIKAVPVCAKFFYNEKIRTYRRHQLGVYH